MYECIVSPEHTDLSDDNHYDNHIPDFAVLIEMETHQVYQNQSGVFNNWCGSGIAFSRLLKPGEYGGDAQGVYTLKKERIFLDRLGTITLYGLSYLVSKVLAAAIILYGVRLFHTFYECLLLCIAVFATENFYMINQMGESGLKLPQILFMQSESLIFNTFLIVLSQTLHPSLAKQHMDLQFIMLRLFSNVFFTMVLGCSWAFLASYSLKQSHQNKDNNFDNFDILMMILSPIVSFLMAESFTISGLQALMTCAFIQSIYAQKNLENERAQLLLSIFRALSYTARAICDILMGIGLGLNLQTIGQIGPLYLIGSIALIQVLNNLGSYLINKKMEKKNLINHLESKILLCQNNTKGLLSYTLALQNFNPVIVSITVVNTIFTSLIIEPIVAFKIYRMIRAQKIKEIQNEEIVVIALDDNQIFDSTMIGESQEDNSSHYGCFKTCLLNFHYFTLSQWLVLESATSPTARLSRSQQFEKFEDSVDTQTQQVELSRLSYAMKYKSKRPHSQTTDYKRSKVTEGDIELMNRKSIDSRTEGGNGKAKKSASSRSKKGSKQFTEREKEEMKLKSSVFL
ncbi:sodium hydrogen exchanger 6-like [Stylonychia lemnae]|uniref:Sodium hydrogen exchanger 6-like n=1 Tax=Stylonychia lemnae TaxID=5949 RepID=A0A078ACS0_STYLE|nr:sodium hydrogen exchanger 6-like [Stylonychia lemnae]|eukprot:CDW79979.1 sodium hydrogen exchanger 6-like [Stylonychia lemnae]